MNKSVLLHVRKITDRCKRDLLALFYCNFLLQVVPGSRIKSRKRVWFRQTFGPRSPSTMPFSFGKSQKSPGEIVRNLKDNIAHMERLDAADKKCEKVSNSRPCLLSDV